MEKFSSVSYTHLDVYKRQLNKDRIARYAGCEWVERCEVMIIISKTGGGKSFLCQALGNAACRKLIRVRYTRLAGICAVSYTHLDVYKRQISDPR